MEEIEIWKDIKGYEGLYQISNIGRVRSFDKLVNRSPKGNGLFIMKGRFLKPGLGGNGYYGVVLNIRGIGKTRTIHSLVAEAFIKNDLAKKVVNHVDGNKKNNHYKNLEYCTYKENNVHAVKIGLIKPAKGGDSHMAKPLLNTLNGVYYDCMKSAYEAYSLYSYKYFCKMLNPNSREKNKTAFIYV